METINTLVWGFNDAYSTIIKRLENDNIINTKVWFIDANVENCENNQFSVREFLYKNSWNLTYNEIILEYEEGIQFNEKIYAQVYKDIYHYIDCESRYEKHGILPIHHYLNKFNMLYKFLYSIFMKNDIKLCIFSNVTHEGLDVIIYNIAKALKIKTIFITQSSIPDHYDKVFYMDEVEDYGNFNFMQNIYDNNLYKIKKTETKDLWYMKGFEKMTFKQWRRLLPFYKKNKYQNFRKYKKHINKLIKPVDYTKKYVYFPLHLQPEMTTSCFGGIYCDQLLALERLSELLPDDYLIYVKENPKQNENQRDPLFFERFKLIKNVRLVPLYESSHKLTTHCQFLATISGTAGWEALTCGKPALVFGNAWYQNFEGCFKYYDGFQFNKINNYKIDFSKLELDYNNLLKRMPKAIIDSDYITALSEYNQDESLDNIFKLLKLNILN